MRALLIIFMCLFSTPAMAGDFKQALYDKSISSAKKLGASTHSALSKAEQLGFVVNEVRFEISTTPKIEVFFRDTGDTGRFEEIIADSNKAEEVILRLLQSTRKFDLAHYSPTGVKLTTGAAKPSIEILTSFQK